MSLSANSKCKLLSDLARYCSSERVLRCSRPPLHSADGNSAQDLAGLALNSKSNPLIVLCHHGHSMKQKKENYVEKERSTKKKNIDI